MGFRFFDFFIVGAIMNQIGIMRFESRYKFGFRRTRDYLRMYRSTTGGSDLMGWEIGN